MYGLWNNTPDTLFLCPVTWLEKTGRISSVHSHRSWNIVSPESHFRFDVTVRVGRVHQQIYQKMKSLNSKSKVKEIQECTQYCIYWWNENILLNYICGAISWSSRVKADHDDHWILCLSVLFPVWGCHFQLVVVMKTSLDSHKTDSQAYLFHSIGSLLRIWMKMTEP